MRLEKNAELQSYFSYDPGSFLLGEPEGKAQLRRQESLQ